jgi:hypothetical protein
MSGALPAKLSKIKPVLPRLRILLAAGLACLFFFCFRNALAKPPADDLSVELQSTSFLFMDDNKWCGKKDLQGPDGAWYHLRVSNTRSNQTFTGLQLTFTAPVSVTIDDPVRYLGNLSPGQSQDVFFFVDYSALRNWGSCASGKTPHNYNQAFAATITSIDHGMNGVREFSQTLTSKPIKSASAGGLFTSHLLGPGAYVGQIMTTTVSYTFGNNDGNTPLLVQPTGNGDFDAGCYRLVGSQVLQSDIDGVNVGVRNTIWFPNTDSSAGDGIKMQYDYEIRCTGGSTRSFPWAQITHGGEQKYASENFSASTGGAGGVELPAPRPIEQATRISADVMPNRLIDGGVVTYTLHIENLVDVPLVVNDIFSDQGRGLAYAGFGRNSNVNAYNSTISPTLGTRGPLRWVGHPKFSFTVPPSGTLGMGQPGAIDLIYTAQVTQTAGRYTTSLSAVIGEIPSPPISLSVDVENSPTAVTLASFEATPEGDDGTRLTWATWLEIDTVGFHILRRRLPNGAYKRITPALILAANNGEINTGTVEYTWLDAGVKSGFEYQYWLEEWTLSGWPEWYGPASTPALSGDRDPKGLYLPLMLH